MLLATASLTGATPALASGPTITGVHVASVSHTSLTVALKSMGRGWSYRLYASTNKPYLYYSGLSKAAHSVWSSHPRMTVSGLRYSTARVWFRVQARKGKSTRTGPSIYSIGLRPDAPTALAATSNAGRGLYLTWSAAAQTSYRIQQATNSAFSQNLVTYLMRGSSHQFTPSGLSQGSTYWFRLRSMTINTPSSWSAPASAVEQSGSQVVRVMTYNVQTTDADGTTEGDGTVAPWSQRVVGAAKLVNEVQPDVVALEESAGFTDGDCNPPRQLGDKAPIQADDLAAHIGGYQVADTEVFPCGSHYFRTGVNIIYNPGTVTPVGAGGHWNVDSATARWAAYQLFHKGAATFLFVAVHERVGGGSAGDQSRVDETNTMIDDARSYAAAHGNAPIVYAGDFNSNSLHPLDGPAVAMKSANHADASDVAQVLVNSKYDSANDDERTPPAFGHSIDHIYAPPGVAAYSWRLVMDLTNGKFVGVIPSDHNPLVGDVVVPF